MNVNGMIGRLVNMFLGKAINHGIDYAARRGKPAAEMTPEERAQAAKGRDMVKRARQAARITRRLGR